ncbi:MarR family transcriptional regulator [Streptomyces sioyaensis]|uniref:MarR family winged helix-turn-helix transcriptional regulator n=1 Tax=Streptomyces sioyaensis TaxID=67364 RepID=UPI001F1B29B8|nr:MarR family transcriptional regulator [Streptomyces sioyaensis]MCF3178147.1 MarR family transcriptional regulator [Streptomyces sioyaensis]
MTEDIVARVQRQWQQVHPGLDTGPMAVIGRLNRCSALLQQAADAPLRKAGLTRPEFDILATLRRMDRELTPGRVARETFASGAAVTKRVRQLEERGLVVRRPDDRDRRVAHLSLTEEGREVVDQLLPEQLEYEASLLAGIGAHRQEELAASLSELLVVLEGRLAGLLD